MTHFLDLEPHLGSSDSLWPSMLSELAAYPLKAEQGYVVKEDHEQSLSYLRREYVKAARSKGKPRAYLDHTGGHTVGPWTTAYDNYHKDGRITLVAQRESEGGDFLPGEELLDRLGYFKETWAYLKNLPIKAFYRVVLINGTPNCPLPAHLDWYHQENPCVAKKLHMLFVNPCNNRPMYYKEGDRKVFTNSSLFLMDNASLVHGVLAEQHYTSLIRVYCALEDSFCDKLGLYRVN